MTLENLKEESPQAYSTNMQFIEEVDEYKSQPTKACDKNNSIKLLKRFSKKDFGEFWSESVSQYFPAVSEGTMKLCYAAYSHDEAIKYAKRLISTVEPKDLSRAFLYGVMHNAPEYRLALASYYYIKNIPSHKFNKQYVGMAPGENGEFECRYSETLCEICGYNHGVSIEPKMNFYWANVDMEKVYFGEHLFTSFDLNSAITFIEEYKRQPKVSYSKEDYEHFKKIIDVIEKAPTNTTPSKLKKELKKSGLLNMTLCQIQVFIDMLGFLNILHSDDSFGVISKHICEKDMEQPKTAFSDASYPVYCWTRKCGIDYDSIAFLFDGLYE